MESEVKSPTLFFNAQSAAKLRIGEGSEIKLEPQANGGRNGKHTNYINEKRGLNVSKGSIYKS